MQRRREHVYTVLKKDAAETGRKLQTLWGERKEKGKVPTKFIQGRHFYNCSLYLKVFLWCRVSIIRQSSSDSGS